MQKSESLPSSGTQREFLFHDFSYLSKGKALISSQDKNGKVDLKVWINGDYKNYLRETDEWACLRNFCFSNLREDC